MRLRPLCIDNLDKKLTDDKGSSTGLGLYMPAYNKKA
jgi:hypothetical protein